MAELDAGKSVSDRGRIGAYSRRLSRGAIGDLVDGRSAQGRFIRHLEAELIAHVGGAPSIAQKLLIDRIIKLRLQLDALDAKFTSGDWTPHDGRTYGGILNAHRLAIRELGVKPAAPRAPTLAELFPEREGAEAAA